MNIFSDELRKERESRNIKLADIARTTRIHIKYLEAIEQGAFDVLPQTYIRAFIKAYAEAVGLNAAEMLHQYEVHVTRKFTDETQLPEVQNIHSYLKPEETDKEIQKTKRKHTLFLLTLLLVGSTLILLYLLNYFDSTVVQKHVKERPFQDVVKETEKIKTRIAKPDTIDTTKIVVPIKPVIVEPDSIVLKVIGIDSVWMTIAKDSLTPHRGYLLKGRYRTYSAKKSFTLSIDDAGLVKIILNGTELQPLGKKGTIVRNKKITLENLKK